MLTSLAADVKRFFIAGGFPGKNKMPNYIYALHCPIANTVRYIGKTNNPEARLIAHLAAAKKANKSHHTAKWLRKLLREGFRPIMEILETLPETENWEEYERFYISNGADFGWDLTNTNPGGEGGGYVRPEDKEKWKAQVKAGFTPEVRAHISAALKVSLNRPETKAKQRANKLAQWGDPAYREEMLRKMREANTTPEVRAKRSASNRRVWTDPQRRIAASERLTAYYATPEGKANKIRTSSRPEKLEASRKSQIALWKTKEYREKQMALIASPELVEKASALSKKLWADPEFKAKRAQLAAERKAAKALTPLSPEVLAERIARKEANQKRSHAKRRELAQAFAASPEGIARAEANREAQRAMFAAMSAASAAKKEQARLDRIAAKNSPEAIAAREAKKLATRNAMYDRRNAVSRAKKEAAGIKVRRSPYPVEQREEMNKQRKKLQRAAKLQAEKAALLAAATSTPYTESS